MVEVNTISVCDSLEGLKQLPDRSIQCVVTSPPYFRLRDYGMDGQYGMENTPEEYIARMVTVFAEVKRVLKDAGTLWIVIGDNYWGSGKATNNPEYQKRHRQFGKLASDKSQFGKPTTGGHPVLKNKDLIGIPWMLAFALREQGWWLRQDIIWYKKNCMPESVTDRCTRCHEYIFMFSKSSKYFYDGEAIKLPVADSTVVRMSNAVGSNTKYSKGVPGQGRQSLFKSRGRKQDGHGPRHTGFNARWNDAVAADTVSAKVNRRSVWHLSTRSFKEKHYATFPLQIPEMCIKAGSREKDIILDPFMGAGTSALAAALLGRNFIGFELNPDYVTISQKRLRQKLGLFYQK